MKKNRRNFDWKPEIIRCLVYFLITAVVSCAVCFRLMNMADVDRHTISEMSDRLSTVEEKTATEPQTQPLYEEFVRDPLYGKKIVYDGDSIAAERDSNGGGYAALIAAQTGSTYENFAVGGAQLCSNDGPHSVVDNLKNLPSDGDLYCFEGGINDYWANTPLGSCSANDYKGKLNTKTVCGAMETIFRYCMENFPGKPICFVIVHKVQNTATEKNANGDTFGDFRDAMVQVCNKYSVPYYDAFNDSGLNGWNQTQSDHFLTGNSSNESDGTHPNAEGYKKYYVPQLLELFRKMIPVT